MGLTVKQTYDTEILFNCTFSHNVVGTRVNGITAAYRIGVFISGSTTKSEELYVSMAGLSKGDNITITLADRRTPDTWNNVFTGTFGDKPLPPALLNYLKSVEILNRQSLPLQPNFNTKVQQYFKNND
jgi:hypothetical protein